MILSSSAFQDMQEIPQKYGKKTENISLPFSWEDAPAGTKSFALSIVDTHPIAQHYVHWLVADIPASVVSLEEGTSDGGLPAGSRELQSYTGPFPPSGTHNYEVTLYALQSDQLDVPVGASLDMFSGAAAKNSLASATLEGTFTKQR
jgi:Raf kinase inhibitor-like YbhB/YbcL family protein